MTLLIPCCGESERFNGIKKQFLMHPSGVPLPIFSASGITDYDKRYFIFTEEDFLLYGDTEFKFYSVDEIILLNHKTESQVQTITLAIQILLCCSGDSIYIKDCDNYFESKAIANSVATIHPKIGFHSTANLLNKSFSLVDNFNFLHCIKERGMYTNYMNVGGYGFANAFDFLVYCNNKKYVTEVIQAAINDNEKFSVNDAVNYIDYGTKKDWDNYLNFLKTNK